MAHKQGVHWIPRYRFPEDEQYIKVLRPRHVTIVNPDMGSVRTLLEWCKPRRVFLRDHLISEDKAAMYMAPEDTARRHVAELVAKYEGVIKGSGLGKDRALFGGINEPVVHSNEQVDATRRYNVTFLDECGIRDYTALALNFSVGNPRNTGEGTPPAWDNDWREVYDAIKRGGHILNLHQYYPREGPNFWDIWLAFRHEQCPWDVPIWIGEASLDDGAYPGRPVHGWQGLISADQHIDWWRYTLRRYNKDSRIITANIYTSDGGKEWGSWYTRDVWQGLAAVAHENPIPPTKPEPGPPPTRPPVDPEPPGDSDIADLFTKWDHLIKAQGELLQQEKHLMSKLAQLLKDKGCV